VAAVAEAQVSETGKPLPPWTRGTLDLHQLSTGRGNSALLVFPDGTTLLVDAGSAADRQPMADTEPRPDASRSAGGWIIRYIERALAPAAPHLDYALLTHFHPDHMGQVTAATPPSKSGAFRLTGLSEVGEAIPIDTLIDRGADRGSFVRPADDETWKNYRAFVDEQVRTRGLKAETIRVGRNDQIVLRRDAAAFPSFEVRNVAANGLVWTGTGDEVRNVFPPRETIAKEDLPTENMCSIGIRIRYGKFDYFTGGDMPGVPEPGAPEWHSIETAVAKAIGPTDVHVTNHHGSIDPASAFFLETLRSPVIIIPAWSATHPSQDSLKRMLTMRLYPAPHDIFVTALRAPTAASIGARVDQLKATHGHIVVRVAPGGDSYRVYVLDDLSPDANVMAVFGPYVSR
jgi:beta-lactamase superfamily II metal-dependent hydrolase